MKSRTTAITKTAFSKLMKGPLKLWKHLPVALSVGLILGASSLALAQEPSTSIQLFEKALTPVEATESTDADIILELPETTPKSIEPNHKPNIPPLSVQASTPTPYTPQAIPKPLHLTTLSNPRYALSTIERELYHRVYQKQPFENRLRRLETTLFGATRRGNSNYRLHQVAIAYEARQQKTSQAKEQAMVSYLETKLFGKASKQLPWPARLNRLESHVFARTFESYPENLRIKKLTYTLPKVLSNLPSSSSDMLVARSSPGELTSYSNRPVYTSRSAKHTATPSSQNSFISGDYLNNIYRSGAKGLVLRWEHLPITLAALNASNADHARLNATMNRWQKLFPMQTTSNPNNADILIDFQPRSSNSQTPSVFSQQHLNDNKQIRTVVIVTAGKASALKPTYQAHALSHWLGHALGIWGHSPIPDDLMYPVHPLEVHDIPKRLNRRSSQSGIWSPKIVPIEATQPSTRDMNTLTRLYTQPFQSLAKTLP